MTESEISELAAEFGVPIDQLRANIKQLTLEFGYMDADFVRNCWYKQQFINSINSWDMFELTEALHIISNRIAELNAARDDELMTSRLHTIVNSLSAVTTLN